MVCFSNNLPQLKTYAKIYNILYNIITYSFLIQTIVDIALNIIKYNKANSYVEQPRIY